MILIKTDNIKSVHHENALHNNISTICLKEHFEIWSFLDLFFLQQKNLAYTEIAKFIENESDSMIG